MLGLVGRRLNNGEIAAKLFLGETIVKTRVVRVLANCTSPTRSRPSSWPTRADWFALADERVGRSG
ncbi:hypothetical protein [Streptomyces rishiriensis]|uniref:hypothetical protein n=1 Tax=Streptomyces rishiriensis TaxID=68264 RepID=UPI0037D929F7